MRGPIDLWKTPKTVGLALWGLGILYGIAVCLFVFVWTPLGLPNPAAYFRGELIGFAFAFVPAITVFIWVPRILDRFEPEPWRLLGMAFLWGSLGAAGIAYTVNMGMAHAGVRIGQALGGGSGAGLGQDILGAIIGASIVEEAMKACFVLGMFLFMKEDFDGPVDGVIYAIFAALGFAVTENTLYYSEALADSDGGEVLLIQFMQRGVLKPWGHPFYTALTGLGIGIARETNKTWLKWLAPIGGYGLAVAFHMGWNAIGLVASAVGVSTGEAVWTVLSAYFFIMLCFLGLVAGLVVREGRILRANLSDEVLLGNMTQGELDMLCSPIGRIKARRAKGSNGVEFLVTAARLGMMKWHMARAMEGQKMTRSADEIVPLRQRLGELKRSMGSHLA